MGLIVERVAQLAASPRNGGLKAAKSLQSPHGLVVVEVAVEAATMEFGLNVVDCGRE